jgi:hypothetical protein
MLLQTVCVQEIRFVERLDVLACRPWKLLWLGAVAPATYSGVVWLRFIRLSSFNKLEHEVR